MTVEHQTPCYCSRMRADLRATTPRATRRAAATLYRGKMQYVDLSDDEAAALVQELHTLVENDRYPLSPRIRTLREILAKLRPEPFGEPLPPRKVYAPPPQATAARRRR
jgi:hypothetical protein